MSGGFTEELCVTLISAGSITFVDEKLRQQGRQLNGVGGVREAMPSFPLKGVHLRVPLHPVERVFLTWGSSQGYQLFSDEA